MLNKQKHVTCNEAFHYTLGTAFLGVVGSFLQFSKQPGWPDPNAFVPMTIEVPSMFFASSMCETSKITAI